MLNELVNVIERQRAKITVVTLIEVLMVDVHNFERGTLCRLLPRRTEIQLAYTKNSSQKAMLNNHTPLQNLNVPLIISLQSRIPTTYDYCE